MDTPPTGSKPETTVPKTRKTSPAGRSTRSPKPRTSLGGSTRRRSAAAADGPLGLDVEQLAQLQEDAARKLREVVRQQPLLAIGAALATGFVVGGGWRTRIGRFLLSAGVRYAATEAAKRYVSL
jgi:hypothetical protein